ncbi:spermidine synthase [Hymenobacter sublimis]|uniref:Fused MFS/spermidine synthase n=1 Tax=Hymenobacter sublimis TaxID=2933777 RepID=A0ABY4J9Q7_9BACT|nr:fused MFS/spermidine synthase [Hymenobacter sublimis]UPL48566.1 fused MFS/spermidine synthase [Hymenobacter sublimis]
MNKLLTTLRYWVSYALPLSRRINSRYSGPLTVELHRGRKVLNAQYANYSYGPLQQILRYGLFIMAPNPTVPVLVLGMGGGSVIDTLRRERKHTGPITALELDPAIVELAATEFDIRPDAQLHIVCADAFAWLPTAPAAAYGLVIIDLFIDLTLPHQLSEAGFWQQLRRVLQPGGAVLLNTLVQAPLLIAGQPAPAYLTQQGFEVKDLEVEYNRLLILRG